MSHRLSSYVALSPPKGAQKRKSADFRLKSPFAWTKSATKFLCVKTVSESCSAFIGLTNRANTIGVGCLLLVEILGQNDRVGAKSPIFDLFLLMRLNRNTERKKLN